MAAIFTPRLRDLSERFSSFVLLIGVDLEQSKSADKGLWKA